MRTDGTTIRKVQFEKHRATAKTIGGGICPGCDTARTEREFRNEIGNSFRYCVICRGRHPKLRKARP